MNKKNISITVFKKILILITSLFALWFFFGVYKWSACGCSDKNYNFTNDPKAMIATMGSSNRVLPKLDILRFKIEEPYHYPFFYPQYFSDFYLLPTEGLDSLIFVLDNKDTLHGGTITQLEKIPAQINVYDPSQKLIATFTPDTIYYDQIKHKPTISIFKQIVWLGPFFQQCIDKCN